MDKFELLSKKIALNKVELQRLVNIYKFQSKKIVFSNGCFDIIHRGHIEYLAKAASLGDILIIGINTDSSVRKLKGENRPVQDETARALVMASLSFVDKIILFDEETPYELINYIKPDILVKGSDYSVENIVGADIVLKNGGKVETIDLVEGYSTSSIIEKACK
ncbi:MAG: D-glycero-beta-D-manno-heptose 1-phosphate adenylyltransferase [Bacteroidales bacterium]|nr:D-glycero-beta-D-manno-heptose 1-phosphate adenylyltransferase [Bacteroidales bacterium]MBN2757903.1 D-glycero-beta-D-manno-heptose 1-phosphate adenylyltransferase [Bacteroidales bacterium]